MKELETLFSTRASTEHEALQRPYLRLFMSFDMSSPCQKNGQGNRYVRPNHPARHGVRQRNILVESNLPGLELRNRAMVRLP
jgi:hypothetical protein